MTNENSGGERVSCPVDHEAVKLSDAAWSELTYRGLQNTYDDVDSVLELRNCHCGTTLARPLVLEDCCDPDCDGCRSTREHGVSWSRARCINDGVRQLGKVA